MKFLYELATQADEFIIERMLRTIPNALPRYKPMPRALCGDGAPLLLRVNPNHQLLRDEAGYSGVSLRRLWRYVQRDGCYKQRADAKAIFSSVSFTCCVNTSTT